MTINQVSDTKFVDRVRDLPIVAIDIGFSSNAKSCGVAWRSRSSEGSVEVRHDVAISEISRLIGDHPETVLIVEAPLSMAFRSNRPTRRGDFEQKVIDGRKKCRDWYVGAGANVFLGAFNLLMRLHRNLNPKSNTLHLIEGFVSFENPSLKRAHKRVAEDLIAALTDRSGTWHKVDRANEVISIVDIIERREPTGDPPLILVPN